MLLDDFARRVFKTTDYGKSMLWIPKLMLGYIFMWPDKKNRFWSDISFLILGTSIIITVLGTFFYVLTHIQEFNKAAYGMSMTILSSMAIVKLPVLWYKRKELESIINDIETDFWPYDLVDDDTKTFLRNLYKYAIIFMIWFFILAHFYATPILFIPFFLSEKSLPFPFDLPVAWRDSPTYEILYITQCIALQVALVIGVLGTDYLVLGICEGAANQYRILQKCFLAFNTDGMIKINNKLRKINNNFEKKYDIRREYFVRCVQHHEFLLRFTKKINEALSPIELGQLFISVCGICLGIFILSQPDTPIMMLFLTIISTFGFLFQLAIDCVIGTDLYYQAMLIPDCIFRSNWAAIRSDECKKDIAFLILHSQRYPQFTAYTLYDMNMTSYVKVLKMAFSLYTLLTNISIKK